MVDKKKRILRGSLLGLIVTCFLNAGILVEDIPHALMITIALVSGAFGEPLFLQLKSFILPVKISLILEICRSFIPSEWLVSLSKSWREEARGKTILSTGKTIAEPELTAIHGSSACGKTACVIEQPANAPVSSGGQLVNCDRAVHENVSNFIEEIGLLERYNLSCDINDLPDIIHLRLKQAQRYQGIVDGVLTGNSQFRSYKEFSVQRIGRILGKFVYDPTHTSEEDDSVKNAADTLAELFNSAYSNTKGPIDGLKSSQQNIMNTALSQFREGFIAKTMAEHLDVTMPGGKSQQTIYRDIAELERMEFIIRMSVTGENGAAKFMVNPKISAYSVGIIVTGNNNGQDEEKGATQVLGDAPSSSPQMTVDFMQAASLAKGETSQTPAASIPSTTTEKKRGRPKGSHRKETEAVPSAEEPLGSNEGQPGEPNGEPFTGDNNADTSQTENTSVDDVAKNDGENATLLGNETTLPEFASGSGDNVEVNTRGALDEDQVA
jgi:hypothetical protein